MKRKLFFAFLCSFGGVFSINAQNTCSSAATAVIGINTVGVIDGTLLDVCGNSWGGSAEWYVYTAAIDAVITVSSNLPQNNGITYSDDTYLNVYSGTCGALVCIGSNDDVDLSNGNYLSSVTFIATAGQTYYFEWADDWNDEAFQFELTEIVVDCEDSITAPFIENFTDQNNILVCWNHIDADGDGNGWYTADYDLNDDDIPDGNPCLASASWNGSVLFPDNWIITLPIDLTGFDSNYEIDLNWLARGIDANYALENYSVYVSTGNTQTDFLASSVNFNEIIGNNGGAGHTFVPRSIDISSFAGQTIYVALRHHEVSNQFVLNIDDLAVSAVLSTDDFKMLSFEYTFSNNILNLLSSDNDISTVNIYNLTGQVVYTNTEVNALSAEINFSNFAAGTYVVNVFDINNNTRAFKVVKK